MNDFANVKAFVPSDDLMNVNVTKMYLQSDSERSVQILKQCRLSLFFFTKGLAKR